MAIDIEAIKERLAARIAFAGVSRTEDQDMTVLLAEIARLQGMVSVATEWPADNDALHNEVVRLRMDNDALRKERDELRAALEAVQRIVDGEKDPIGTVRAIGRKVTAALSQPAEIEAAPERTPRFEVGETVRVDRFIDDAFAGWLGEIEHVKRVGDTFEYYLSARNLPGLGRYPFGWFAEKLIDNNDNVPDWVEGMDKEAD